MINVITNQQESREIHSIFEMKFGLFDWKEQKEIWNQWDVSINSGFFNNSESFRKPLRQKSWILRHPDKSERKPNRLKKPRKEWEKGVWGLKNAEKMALPTGKMDGWMDGGEKEHDGRKRKRKREKRQEGMELRDPEHKKKKERRRTNGSGAAPGKRRHLSRAFATHAAMRRRRGP